MTSSAAAAQRQILSSCEWIKLRFANGSLVDVGKFGIPWFALPKYQICFFWDFLVQCVSLESNT